MNPVRVVEGAVTHIARDNVDTDQIIPARFMKRVERTGFGEYCFHEWRAAGYDLPANPILVAGDNFGCGSSREHAPWALLDYGFRALVAPRFADIFKNNCTKNGLLPIELPADACAELVRRGRARVDLGTQTVDEYPFAIDAEVKRRLLDGLDDISITLSAHADAIDAYERDRARRGPVTTEV
ncbi:3-isopropylmalate dehydratase small subunit [Pilimelia anulata]|uniref:3-isopropylmalate dehydratase small subunit n=1 Tax=Pilimelia anulata TaxID=53371 RepID=A0A8J3B211_9ACTN|nr:3-isopropylmalate dehydratase small subunit [Pilimelia anulata]GGJ78768.1 3-isopropylmalate dehydratase small subunit [Pilimelia anulata]